jgi:4-hydroxybenzoate polyprenyltransferase
MMNKHSYIYLKKIKSFIRLSRPKQWIKNAFVFAPLLFSVKFLEPKFVILTFWASICFCIVSSAIYVMNDYIDLEKDKTHPKKKERPLASGEISRKEGMIFFIFLLGIVVLVSYGLGLSFFGVLVIYILNNILYSFILKNRVILDVMSVAFGFILRVIGGAIVIQVGVSPWLLLCTLLLALFLGFSKRRHELILLDNMAGEHRKILKEYSIEFIDHMLSVVTSSIFIGYFLYTFFNEQYLMLTIPFVLYGIFRYQYILYQKKEGGSPEESLVSDKPLLVNILVWAISSGVILLLH